MASFVSVFVPLVPTNLQRLHSPACGKLRNHNILRCADILTLRLQSAVSSSSVKVFVQLLSPYSPGSETARRYGTAVFHTFSLLSV